jgi:hypothetical protein
LHVWLLRTVGALNSTHIHGTSVPVEEPSTASIAVIAAIRGTEFVEYRAELPRSVRLGAGQNVNFNLRRMNASKKAPLRAGLSMSGLWRNQ